MVLPTKEYPPKGAEVTRYRGDNIPPVSDYAHWNEDAEMMHYLENRYDMMYADEPLDDFDEDYYDDEGD